MPLFAPPLGASIGQGQPQAGGSTFTDMLNQLSGSTAGQGAGMDWGSLNNGLQSLAYGIGSFAKDPRRREMYIQAAMAHQQHMSADKAQHLRALQEHGNQILDFIQKSNGDPKVLNILQQVIARHVNALAALGGKEAAQQFAQTAQAVQAMPPPAQELVPIPGPDGKPIYGPKVAGAGVYEKPAEQALPSGVQEYQFAQKQGFKGTFQEWETQQKIAGRTPAQPDRTMVAIYDPSPDNPTHQRMIPRDQYAGQPTGTVNQTTPSDVMGTIMQKVQQGGMAALTPNDKAVIDLNKQINPIAAWLAAQLGGGGAAPAEPAALAAPAPVPQAAAPAPAPAGPPAGAMYSAKDLNGAAVYKLATGAWVYADGTAYDPKKPKAK